MAVTRTHDFGLTAATRPYSLQIERELGLAESVFYESVASPESPLVNMTDRKCGRFTVKQACSADGWNESSEANVGSAAPFAWSGSSSPFRQGVSNNLFWAGMPPTGWVKPNGWGVVAQWYGKVNIPDPGGPCLMFHFDALGTGNGAGVGGFVSLKGGGGASTTNGLVKKNWPFNLTADVFVNLILEMTWSGYSKDPLYQGTGSTTLVGAVNDTVGSGVLASLPAGTGSPGFSGALAIGHVLKIDNELLEITAIDTPTKTITWNRHHDSSSAAAHSNGATVKVMWNYPPAGSIVGAMKGWICYGEPSASNDFSPLFDELDIPTLMRPVSGACYPSNSSLSGGSCSARSSKTGLYRASKCKKDTGSQFNNNILRLQGGVGPFVDPPEAPNYRCELGPASVGSPTQPDNTIYIGGKGYCDTLDEARSEFGLSAPGTGTDADVLASLPALTGGRKRYGNLTLYPQLNQMGTDRKRVGYIDVPAGKGLHVDKMYYGVGIPGTGTITVKIIGFNDDGASGEPMTILRESAEKSLVGPLTNPGWLYRDVASWDAEGRVWVGGHLGGATNTLKQATDGVTAAGYRVVTDTYVGGVASPETGWSSAVGLIAIAIEGVEYDITPPPPTDTTAPALVVATVEGDDLIEFFDETLLTTSVPLRTDLTVLVNAVARVVTGDSEVSGSTVRWHIDPPVDADDVVTYSRSGGRVKDLTGNPADPVTDQATTNITVAPQVFRRYKLLLRLGA